MFKIVDEDGEEKIFESASALNTFKKRPKRLGIIKKEIERRERNKLSEFLRNVTAENEQHKIFLIEYFNARIPKWKKDIMNMYVWKV
jgi:hypothetical protein